ncbi:hypothetical protein GCM10011365_15170 [Marinicella pacifica]|uniref:Secreted protein n=1 Tax=Marinicella pacifica TaxID=1171543 RepID=A0A917CQ02_9GAMM|nr:hypothetical protein [Marinicella pacifica]GGF94814.1 hypothetical protein GCM10011365_15170 [Marinicella pacifica]
MKKRLFLVLVTLTFASSVAVAAKGDQPYGNQVLYSEGVYNPNQPASTPNSTVVLNLVENGGVASWDGLDDVDNVIENCISGSVITGVGFDNVTVESVGLSWLSEAVMLFSNSDGSADPNWISLTVGIGDDFAGTGTYGSGGVIDFTDNSLPDIVANGDGLFQIQFFESWDDVDGSIDANFTSGTLTIAGTDLVGTPGPGCNLLGAPAQPALPVPANNNFALFALLLSVLGLGFFAIRRYA